MTILRDWAARGIVEQGRSTTSFYESLPVYKRAVDAVIQIDGAVQQFKRFHKYTIGQQMRLAAIAVVQAIPAANQREGRAAAMQTLTTATENLKILVNLGKEVLAFASFAQHAQITATVVDLARQTQAWKRYSMGKAGPERPRPPKEGAP